MNLLALDTSTLRASLAIGCEPGGVWTASTDPATRHGRMLVPAIHALLSQAHRSVKELDVIAVGVGPGSYTGLRVGVMAAKTLAYAWGARLIPLDSMEFFARSAPVESGPLTVLVDAQRGDFHVAEYHRGSPETPLERTGPIRIVSAEVLSTTWKIPVRVAGPGITSWKGAWPETVQVLPTGVENPAILLTMTREAIGRGEFADPFTLEPGYVRESAAEDLWRARHPESFTPSG